MSALESTTNPIFDSLKAEVNKLVWELFDTIKDDSVPIHISIYHIPLNVEVKIANLADIVEKLVGIRKTDTQVIPASTPE